jgi:hypothetical protein
LYIAELEYKNSNKYVLNNVKAVDGSINTFRVGGYSSVILLMSNSGKKLSCLKLIDENKKFLGTVTSPLENKALNCCGGYSNINGCNATNHI